VLNKYDITRPNKIMTALRAQLKKAKTDSHRKIISQRHEAVGRKAKEMINLVFITAFSEKMN